LVCRKFNFVYESLQEDWKKKLVEAGGKVHGKITKGMLSLEVDLKYIANIIQINTFFWNIPPIVKNFLTWKLLLFYRY